MEYKEFLDKLVIELSKQTRGNVSVHINHILKNNHSPMDSITIRMEGENAAPAIYTETFYRQYKDGMSMEEVVSQVLSYHYEHKISGYFDVSLYLDFEKIKSGIVCRIVNYERNREMLKNVPHRRFLDLAVIYYHKMDDPVFGNASVLLRSSHLEMWNISEKELHKIALENTRDQGVSVLEIGTLVEELEEELPKERELMYPMFVMTNPERCFGAVNMIFYDILEQIAERTGGNFYLLPSSVHECMVVPEDDDFSLDPQNMKQMVMEINQAIVIDEEILSDSVYYYMRDRKLLVLAA